MRTMTLKKNTLCPYCNEYHTEFSECESCGVVVCRNCSIGLNMQLYCVDCYPEMTFENCKREVVKHEQTV